MKGLPPMNADSGLDSKSALFNRADDVRLAKESSGVMLFISADMEFSAQDEGITNDQ